MTPGQIVLRGWQRDIEFIFMNDDTKLKDFHVTELDQLKNFFFGLWLHPSTC